jgi:hypothetical protein
MSLKFSDIIEDCAIEMNDKDYVVFGIDDWKRYIDSTQHESYPRLYRRLVTNITTLNDTKEYDVSKVTPKVREVDEIFIYDNILTDKIPRRIVDWDFDKTQDLIRLRYQEDADKIMKVNYVCNLADLDEDADIIDLEPEARTLIKKLAVRTALKTLLNDLNKMEKYRVTVDTGLTPYAITNTIAMYDRDIEMRLREIKLPLTPSRVKKPYQEYVDTDNPEFYIEHGDY